MTTTAVNDQPEPVEDVADADVVEEPSAPEPEPAPETETVAEPEKAPAGREVVLATPRGSLTLRPNQTMLDEEQKAALLAINIDVAADPGVTPHLRGFMHMCQVRDLDPWAREAYLIGRGRGNNRKYTMQTGIDGYRKMANATGRFIRVKSTLWTGSDDDDRSYREAMVDGDVVMRRVWFDQWPASRGNPGAAKVVIEHYDGANNVVSTSAVADWGMYAPYEDVWEGSNANRRKKVDGQGNPVQALNGMWTKGGPHMLAKCAEALADRKAFPAAMSGIYVTEEMHRLDQAERERERDATNATRRRAYEESQRAASLSAPAQSPPAQGDDPVHVSEPLAEVITEAHQGARETQSDAEATPATAASDAEALPLLRAELALQAETLGKTEASLASRAVAAARKNLDEFTVAEMTPLVTRLRGPARAALAVADPRRGAIYADLADAAGDGPLDVVGLGEQHAFDDCGEYGACRVCGEQQEAHQ